MPTQPAHPARARAALALALCALALLVVPAHAAAGSRTHAPAATGAGVSAVAAERVAEYWTPRRMGEARPLDLVLDRDGTPRLRAGAPDPAGAAASFKAVETPDVPPYSFNGRIFLQIGRLKGYCSGTAINSPTRTLVLTAGHCVNTGPQKGGRRAAWANYLAFVPAYSGGLAPFGLFVARSDQVFAPTQWTKQGNPDFDLGAFLTRPNEEGVNLADAVGGGASIVFGLPRAQRFSTFGYPGRTEHMQGCQSSYLGDDVLTYRFPGPPTLGIGCRWAPGASGGGWLIADGTQINGVNSYLHVNDKKRTYGPYFSKETVGKLVRGL